ncbi:uncharacterized protein BCR38DRAFT_134054 [Pseudomassariella vexata]|uniref:Uncharacterized protein n=1 Tax=Pseudomassariella vexata TaxID=1141098 RepID=A0A1Y2EB63_9PEZI|nr:uncharacterized protein BCR38DRAFT_134054 [Pseudomassariella vexata]ORY68544.1 hypothetical protein BCR38DRAFT_134054 [Pseudomassariella vexata]
MMSDNPIAKLGLSCPNGGRFYICQDSDVRFLGCCDIDPCADGSGDCPSSSLYGASFNKDSYNNVDAQDCISPYGSSTWWTCQNAKPPFIGCCLNNPCNDGCAEFDVLAARLSDDSSKAAPFLTSSSSSSPYITTTSSSATSETPTNVMSINTDINRRRRK